MSTTGLIGTDGNWYLNQTAPFNLNYSSLTRSTPQYTKTIAFGGGSSLILFNNNEITVQGIYLCTIQGGFNSTPWVLRLSFFMPAGFQQLTNVIEDYGRVPALHSLHADNGVGGYRPYLSYLAVGTNYERPGFRFYMLANMTSGTFTVNMYRVI